MTDKKYTKLIAENERLHRYIDEQEQENRAQYGYTRKNAVAEFIENLLEILDENGIDYYEFSECIDRAKEEMEL